MTERAEHTAGPWKQQCFLVTGAGGSRVCHTGMGNLPPSRSHESEANARLIAAAPDLLQELKDILEWALVEKAPLREQEIRSIRTAISRATGEA